MCPASPCGPSPLQRTDLCLLPYGDVNAHGVIHDADHHRQELAFVLIAPGGQGL